MAAKTAKQKAAEKKAKLKAAAEINAPAGSEAESKDEFQETKLANRGRIGSIENFLKVKKEEEDAQRKATSSDLEVLKNVSVKELLELQGIDQRGNPTGEAPRLYGYDPKTKTALVLKKAFVEEQKKGKGK